MAAAEAEAIEAHAGALADGNQALIAANKLIDALPTLVGEAAKGITGSNLTILDGTDGVNQIVAGLVGQGLSIYDSLRHSTALTGGTSPNGVPSKSNEPPTN